MKLLGSFIAMTALLAGGLTATAAGGAEPPGRCEETRARILCETQELREKVWSLQDEMGVERTPTTYADRDSESTEFRLWVRDLWKERLERVREQYDGGWGIINAAWPQEDEWDRVAQCETGGDWQWNSGTFQGALGFHYGAWDDWRLPGYPTEAYWASRYQQMRVAERIYNAYGMSAWGCGGAA